MTVIGYEHIRFKVKSTLMRLTRLSYAGSISVTNGSFSVVPKASTVTSPKRTKRMLSVAMAHTKHLMKLSGFSDLARMGITIPMPS